MKAKNREKGEKYRRMLKLEEMSQQAGKGCPPYINFYPERFDCVVSLEGTFTSSTLIKILKAMGHYSSEARQFCNEKRKRGYDHG